MRNRVSLFFLVLIALVAIPTIAKAQQINVRTDNSTTIIDDDDIYLDVEPLPNRDRPSSQINRNTSRLPNRPYSQTQNSNDSNCRTEQYTYQDNTNGSSTYSHSSTTVCR